MKNSILIKAITLLGFFTLIVSFLFYRNGSFENFFGSHNGGVTDNSIKPRTDSLEKLRMSSSKVLVLTPQEKRYVDSFKALQTQQNVFRKRTLLSTSKSMVIAQPYITKIDSSKIINPFTGKHYLKKAPKGLKSIDSSKVK